jgi:serine/threonine-protein kinase
VSKKPEPTRTVGGYELGVLVEERGLLATWEAVHRELGRKAFVRAAAPSVAPTPKIEELLLREGRTLASLHHEGLPALYEIVHDEGGSALVLEHPGGPPLSEVEKALAARGGLAVDEALAVVVAVAAALGHLHERGLVHGRVSSRTVHVSATRGVVLMGLDRLHEEGAAQEPRGPLSDASELSPEELMDEPSLRASDVFALGVLAYELVAGRHPFGSPGPDLPHRIRTERPTPFPATRRPPVDAERAILRALAKQPGLRQADAAELGREIAASLAPRVAVGAKIAAFTARAGLGKGPSKASTDAATEALPDRRALDVGVRLGALLAAMIALAVGVEVAERSGRPSRGAETASAAPGFVRVLAHPWAEIWIDGVSRDTTPVARPFELSAGRHTVVLKHPRAGDERKVIDVAPGEVQTIDVEMRVVAPPVDAGVDASP